MELSWLESIIYAFISGLTEFLPVSSRAHQSLMLQLFGDGGNVIVLNFLIHFSVLLSLIYICQNQIALIRRTRKLMQIPPKRRKRNPNKEISAKYKLIRSASIPVLIFTIFFKLADVISEKLQFLAFFLLLNGVVLYITNHIRTGNKKASSMTGLDGFLIGLTSGLGIIPGFSRVGLSLSVAHMRGVSAADALDWSFLLSIPALAALCIADIILMFTVGVGSFTFMMLLQCIISAIAACFASFVGVSIMRYLSIKVGYSIFSYYCWGISLFSFILFMI